MGNESEMAQEVAEALCDELSGPPGPGARAAWEAGEESWVEYLAGRIEAGLEAMGLRAQRWCERSPFGSSVVLRAGGQPARPSVLAVLSGPRQVQREQLLYDLWKVVSAPADARLLVAAPALGQGWRGPGVTVDDLASFLRAGLATRLGGARVNRLAGEDPWLLLGSTDEPWRPQVARLQEDRSVFARALYGAVPA